MNLPASSAWATRISDAWRAGAESIIQAGKLLANAKASLPADEFESMIERDLPFVKRTAERLMAIAADERLTRDPTRVSLLPPSWGSIYELTQYTDEELERQFAEGKVRPDLERSEIVAQRKALRREPDQQAYADRVAKGCTVTDLNQLIADGYRAGAILADPNWQFVTYSDKGKDRSPDQHYKTSPLDPIKALPVKDLAAKNCVLHLWCMDWLLDGAIEVIDAWGFKLINVGFIWRKLNPSGNGGFMGMGHWTRNGAELCLLATKGHPVRRSAAVMQVIEAPVTKHSEKPETIYTSVERLSGGPYLELYARKERPGWVSWGDEIPRQNFARYVPKDAAGEIVVHDADGVIPDTSERDEERDQGSARQCPQPATQNQPDEFPEMPAFLRRLPA